MENENSRERFRARNSGLALLITPLKLKLADKLILLDGTILGGKRYMERDSRHEMMKIEIFWAGP